MKTLVLVAESSRARIFLMEKKGLPLREIEDLNHSESREHAANMGSDRPGRAFDSAGQGRHAMGKESEAKHQEAIHFARQIADRLERARNSGECESIFIAAPPEFLGQIRAELSAPTAKIVGKEISKNLVRHSEVEIREHLTGG